MRARPAAVPAAVWAVAATLFAGLVATAGRYGYHRDELYFLAAGRHLAWGYPDQPALVPALARLVSTIAPGSLVALRVPSALAAAGVVVATAGLAREYGAGRAGRVLAAAVMALAAVVLGTGHLFSTATFALLASVVLLRIVVRVLHGGDPRLWLLAGGAAGAGLLANDFVLLVAGSLAVAVAVVGPRAVFRSGWLWAGVAVAAALWSPYLVWQAGHGWPQLTVARSIASGGSGTSAPRAAVLPVQLGLVSLWLAPVWVAGLVRLLRDDRLRPSRSIAVGYFVALAVTVAVGGKPYYAAGFFAPLVAAGAGPVVGWARHGRSGRRRAAVAAGFVLTLPQLAVMLPLVPAGDLHRTPVVALNYDAGETVGWPAYVDEIAAVARHGDPGGRRTVVVTANYGEAGAVDRYGAGRGLAPAYSGHNGYWWWGPPPERVRDVVAVGFHRGLLDRWFTSVRLAGRLDNRLHVDDDEQGAPVYVCRGLRGTWSAAWPAFRSLG